MISAFTNIFKIPELRQRVLFTLAMIVIIRAGSAITTPGVNAEILREWFRNVANAQAAGGVASLFNLFSGGALAHCAIFSLGIMPYISASIMLQLLTAVVPQLGKLAREDGGRRKIMQYTRYSTIALCVFQGYLLSKSFENPQANPFLPGIMDTINRLGLDLLPEPGIGFQFMTIITMTAGTMFLMWMGDQITERGIGNGVSLIITVGILAQLPAGLIQAWRTFVPSAPGAQASVSPIVLVLLCLFLVFVIASVIAVTQAQRKISIQYAKRVVGRKVYGGQTHMPLKINYAGVMPIIFLSDSALSVHDHQHGFPAESDGAGNREPFGGRLAALRALWGDDLLFQLLLGGDAVPTGADRRRLEKIRRFHPGCPPRKANRGFSRLHDVPAHLRRRHLSHGYRRAAATPGTGPEGALHDRAVFRRHGRSDHRGGGS
jgi:preprotein translocase SecY subunit